MSVISSIFKLFLGGKNVSRVSVKTAELINKEWKEINQMLKGKSPAQLKQALIMADKTVDNALRDLVDGETTGARLKNAKEIFKADTYLYDKLWKAHKTRNALVHESGYSPPHYVLMDSVKDIKDGLEFLGVKVN